MAETRQQQTQQAEAQQPAPRPCPQDCNLCSISQQVFCCTRMLFDLSRAEMETRRRIAAVEQAIEDIRAQLRPKEDALQPSIPDPAKRLPSIAEQQEESQKDTAQQGGGAKE